MSGDGKNARGAVPTVSEIVATGYGFGREQVDNETYFARCQFPITEDRAALVAETRMKQRTWCAPDENTWTMARAAVERALAAQPGLKDEIDVVLVTSGTTMPVLHPPDRENAGMADLAPLVLQQLGRDNVLGLDLKACYCTGFLRAMQTMDGLLTANENYRAGLIVSTEQGSRFSVAPTNRSSFCFLSGDAAGAVVLRKVARAPGVGIVDYVGHTDASKLDWVGVGPDGVSMVNKGTRVAKAVMSMLVEGAQQLLRRNGLTLRDVRWLLPLQTHALMVDGLARAVECPKEKLLWFGDETGLSGSASIPSCLAVQREKGVIQKGDSILSTAVGAGLNAAAALYHA